MPIRGLIFDLFGTLVTRGAGPRAYRELIVKLPPWKWRRARWTALTESLPTIVAFGEHFGLRCDDQLDDFERLVREGIADVRLYADSVPALEQARARGLKLALLSNLASPYKQPVFDLGLDAQFDELVFSCDVGMAKPQPEIFIHVAELLELSPSELVMIGDSRGDDIRGARRAGIHALHIDRKGARGDLQGLDELFEHPLLA